VAKQNNPGSAGTLRRAAKHAPAVSGPTYRQRKRPDNDAIWGACREVQDAAALRKARQADRVKSAALKLGGFKQHESGRWVKQCPGCEWEMELCTARQRLRV